MKKEVKMNPNSKWYGPKQIGMMLYTAMLLLIGTCIIGGNNNTVFPMFSEIRGWDVSILNIVSGIGCILKAVGVLVLARTIRKIGAKNLTVITLFISAALLFVFGSTQSLPVFLVVILILGFLGGGYEKNGGMTLTANWWPTKKGVVLGFTTMAIVAMNFVYVPVMPKLLGAIGLGGGMSVIAVILIVVAVIGLVCVKNTPEEAGEYPDGDTSYAASGADISKQMQEYKSPFTLKKVLADKNTWFIGLGSAFAFMAVMSYIASAITSMMAYGYEYTFATRLFAVGGVMGIIGSFLFGLLDQKIGTKKAFVGYFIMILIGFVVALFMPKGAIFCWICTVIIFIAQGALCNLLPSYVATKYGRWDYTSGYQVIGFMFEAGAGVGVMMTGFFASANTMYIFDIICLAIGLVFMALSSDKFVGKAG
ncbi:MAG: MFS transporter [Lachnospiraceae bacterium]|nr:MFS transporter [Lachnospiraceae bacterium]